MAIDSSGSITVAEVIVAPWSPNVSTDCFNACRTVFARVSGNLYAEKLVSLRSRLGVTSKVYSSTTDMETSPRLLKQLVLDTRQIL